jgi:hypothetical protein
MHKHKTIITALVYTFLLGVHVADSKQMVPGIAHEHARIYAGP